ncbi:hypothetical protein SKAU_G00000520 [Synaphobranchus kaupii]|uniref:WD repeat-containing protein on Y chromosome n=1 Tax=Synaphobranchus kaupii TaxID=118154 RepID=A0A9Q1JCF7_SYNKA|nr:hypothetical protein SKAU_G00000520 [Synaphobranchus kaupii]
MESTTEDNNLGNKKSQDRGLNPDRDKEKHDAEQQGACTELAKNGELAEQAENRGKCPIEAKNKDKHRSLLEAVFHDPNFKVHESLNMAKFREVMRNIGVNANDEDLNIMFMKVDANCDGKVFWEEFKMYLLLENEARDSMHKSLRRLYFPEHIKILRESMQRSNSKAVVGLQFYSFKHPQAQEEQVAAGGWGDDMCKTRIEPGQYMSITQDGKLSYWTENLKHLYTLKLDDLKQAHAVLYQKIWVTHMICMRNIDLLAISSTSNHLEFYDISARKCTIAFTLTGVEPVTVMDYWSDGKRAVFSIGDVSGCVTIFTSRDVGQNGIFNRRTSKTGTRRSLASPKTRTCVFGTSRTTPVFKKSAQVKYLWAGPPITAVHYTRETNTLVIATSLMGVLQGEMEDLNARLKESTHKDPVCAALYNTHFKQVVSGCYSGVVCVWDILTGDKAMEFHTSSSRDMELTAMAFDVPQRRLLTGSNDGMVRLWNFNNGVLLMKLPVLDKNEVTGILHFNNKIYMSGWSKRVICYKHIQKEGRTEHNAWRCYHTEDIYSINTYGSKILVTASHNGDIIVWNTSTEEPLCWFNASQGPRPLLLDSLKDKATQRRRGDPEAARCGFQQQPG